MNSWLLNLALLIFSYLCGSLPFAVWVTYILKGRDVRGGGSGHAGATNTMRQAGWLAGSLVLVLDLGKGALPVALTLRFGTGDWLVPVAAVCAVAGHCWPIWADFRGGMGLATAGGATLVVSPLAFLVGVGLLIGLLLVIRHAARAAVTTGALLGPVFWLLGFGPTTALLGVGVGAVIVLRFRQDWARQYRELWLDREQEE